MSTSTMMSNQHRRFPTRGFVDPTFKKRKERESDGFELEAVKKSKKPIVATRPGSTFPVCPKKQVLAGYLAHEFLSKGTLFGQAYEYDPAGSGAEPRRVKPVWKAEPEEVDKNKRYAEVADLLKTEEAHLPGIVNPAQLARFLQP